jgi:hypothetical protein
MSETNPDPNGHAYYQASDGRWYPFDQAPPGASASSAANDAHTQTSEARALRSSAAKLRGLAGFFQFLGWLTVILGVVAGIAIASQSGSSTSFSSNSFSSSSSDYTTAGLFSGALICVSGLWLVLLARCAEVLGRYTAMRSIDQLQPR